MVRLSKISELECNEAMLFMGYIEALMKKMCRKANCLLTLTELLVNQKESEIGDLPTSEL